MPNCPIRCGNCCTFWAEIPSLRKKWPDEQEGMLCPECGPDGCRLDPKPRVCAAYLCEGGEEELRRLKKEAAREKKDLKTMESMAKAGGSR